DPSYEVGSSFDRRSGGHLALDRVADSREGLAHQVLHRDVVAIALGLVVVNATDMWMNDPRGDARFVEEHFGKPRLLDEVGMNPLERHETIEPGARGHTSQVNGSHAT